MTPLRRVNVQPFARKQTVVVEQSSIVMDLISGDHWMHHHLASFRRLNADCGFLTATIFATQKIASCRIIWGLCPNYVIAKMIVIILFVFIFYCGIAGLKSGEIRSRGYKFKQQGSRRLLVYGSCYFSGTSTYNLFVFNQIIYFGVARLADCDMTRLPMITVK